MVKVVSRGKLQKTYNFLNKILSIHVQGILNRYGEAGCELLSQATPKDTGLTASSWFYNTFVGPDFCQLEFCNSNINDGYPIVFLIEYGHGTGWGGYVPPHPFIQDTLQPLYDELEEVIWKEYTNG